MAGGFRRGNRKRTPKLEGRGELQEVEREGPFKEWLGMPDLYRYRLVVDGETFSYQTEDSEIPVAVGDKVVFVTSKPRPATGSTATPLARPSIPPTISDGVGAF